MSSHRDYENDKEWSWLRNQGLGLQLLHFEPVGDSEDENMYELVVDAKWTTRVSGHALSTNFAKYRFVQVVSNRADGSFASGDLYAKHPTKPNTWRYHGRTDDIVVLVCDSTVEMPVSAHAVYPDDRQESVCQSARDRSSRLHRRL